jgi:type IV pilus assembly protein PilA
MRFIKRQRGFTLVELIIVLAILGILAVIAMQSMSGGNITKAQFMEGFELGKSMKSANSEYYAKHGDYPDNTVAADGAIPVSTDVSGEYVAKVETQDNKILVTFKTQADNPSITSDLAGKLILLTGTSSGISTKWSCDTDVSSEISPTSCTGDQTGLSL